MPSQQDLEESRRGAKKTPDDGRATLPPAPETGSFARRRLAHNSDTEIEVRLDDLRIDFLGLKAFLAGRELQLTVQEFDLLAILARSAGKLIAAGELEWRLWGEVSAEHKRHLGVLIARLRSKLAASRQYSLRTVRKRGYGLMLPSASRMEQIKNTEDSLDVLEASRVTQRPSPRSTQTTSSA